jgi:preprotein translocase subunit SecD
MNKNRLITMIFLTASFLTACGQTKKNSLIEKTSIDIERFDRIEIYKHAIPPDTTKYAPKVLTVEQAKSFIDKWNHTDNPKLCQFDKLELTESKYDNEKYPMIIIRFDSKGTDNWSIATEKSIGGKLALIINDKLVIAPKVNAQITAGVSAINRPDYSKQDIDEIFKTIENERNEK